MGTLVRTVLTLCGILLTVAGVATILVTGLDWRFSLAGLAAIVLGLGVSWLLQRHLPLRPRAEDAGLPGHRSRPLPASPSRRATLPGSHDRKI